jgi:hypothetical protein
MSPHGRPKGEFPNAAKRPLTGPRGTAQRQGGDMSPHGRPKGEFPPGGTARSAKGAT